MNTDSVMIRLIQADDWGEFAPLMTELKGSPYWNIFYTALTKLNIGALYMSHVHGIGHIERTMLHGAMCALADALSTEDGELLMLMCSYHDTGRVSDWLDNAHGLRSSLKLKELTGLEGEQLRIAKAGIEAHSVADRMMEEIIAKHAPRDIERARLLAELLKDADGLDRVRIKDLNVKFLRRDASRRRAEFAQYLFDKYSALSSEAAQPEKLDGFEFSTIMAVKNHVSEYLTKGFSCAQTTIIALGNLLGIIIGEQLLAACAGLKYRRCGMVDAGLMMIGVYFTKRGVSNEMIARLCTEYFDFFEKQYNSVLCEGLSPSGSGLSSCESLSVDVILYTFKYITDKNEEIGGV